MPRLTRMKDAEAIQKGAKVFLRDFTGEWGDKRATVMCVCDNYAMCRFKGAMPFVARLKDCALF